MRAFKFRLDSYLKLKVHEEKSAWNEVLKQQGRVSQLEEYIHTINEAMSAARADLSGSGVNEKYSIGKAEIVAESLSALTVKLSHIFSEKAKEEKVLESLRQKYFEKKKEAKTIENLKDRRKAEYVKEQSKFEDKKNEEIAQTMARSKELARKLKNE